MTVNDRTSFLDEALSYASQETRYHVADSLACHLHNDGYTLEGNTEATDVEWFARNVYEREPGIGRWDLLTDEQREKYRATVRNVIAVLPDYQLRVAHRLIALSKVVRDIERAERAEWESRKKTKVAR